MEWFKFVHIVTIVGAIAVAEAPILPTLVAARRGDVEGIRRGVAASELGEKVANPLVLISLAAGVAAALTGQFDLTASWLVASYALLGSAVLLGVGGGLRHEQRIMTAAVESPSDSPSEELEALLKSRWTGAIFFLPPLLMVSIIFMMVLKPSLW